MWKMFPDVKDRVSSLSVTGSYLPIKLFERGIWVLFNLPLLMQLNCVRSIWRIWIIVLHTATFKYIQVILTTIDKELNFVSEKFL